MLKLLCIGGHQSTRKIVTNVKIQHERKQNMTYPTFSYNSLIVLTAKVYKSHEDPEMMILEKNGKTLKRRYKKLLQSSENFISIKLIPFGITSRKFEVIDSDHCSEILNKYHLW